MPEPAWAAATRRTASSSRFNVGGRPRRGPAERGWNSTPRNALRQRLRSKKEAKVTSRGRAPRHRPPPERIKQNCNRKRSLRGVPRRRSDEAIQPFDKPFDKLRVPSEVEGLMAPSRVEGLDRHRPLPRLRTTGGPLSGPRDDQGVGWRLQFYLTRSSRDDVALAAGQTDISLKKLPWLWNIRARSSRNGRQNRSPPCRPRSCNSSTAADAGGGSRAGVRWRRYREKIRRKGRG